MLNRLKSDFRVKYLFFIFILIGGYLLFYLFPQATSRLFICPTKAITGLPCPACGSTRATLHLLQGEWREALLTNPLVFITHLLLFISGGWMSVDIWKNKETFLPTINKHRSPYLLIALFVLLAFNMLWNIKKGL